MKFLLGQRLVNNNFFCTTCIIPHPRNNHATELNKKKLKIELNKKIEKLN